VLTRPRGAEISRQHSELLDRITGSSNAYKKNISNSLPVNIRQAFSPTPTIGLRKSFSLLEERSATNEAGATTGDYDSSA
jgi:hypothetical protein